MAKKGLGNSVNLPKAGSKGATSNAMGSTPNKNSMSKASSTGKKGGSVGAVGKANNRASVDAAISASKKSGPSFAGVGNRYESAAMKQAPSPSKKSPAKMPNASGAPMKSFVNADKDKGHGKNKGRTTPPSV